MLFSFQEIMQKQTLLLLPAILLSFGCKSKVNYENTPEKIKEGEEYSEKFLLLFTGKRVVPVLAHASHIHRQYLSDFLPAKNSAVNSKPPFW